LFFQAGRHHIVDVHGYIERDRDLLPFQFHQRRIGLQLIEGVGEGVTHLRGPATDEARYRGLVSTGAVSASTYDQIKATSDGAQAQLAAVEAQAQVTLV
jgi:multidrug resistance efflux pump